MISIVHILIGGALGVALGQAGAPPLAILAAGVASHFVADAIPHIDHPPAPRKNDSLVWTPAVWTHAFIDSFLALGVAVYLWQTQFPEGLLLSPFWVGAVGGVLPDLIDNIPLWNKQLRSLPGFKQFHAFHEATHQWWYRYFPVPTTAVWPNWWWLGVATQLVALAVSLRYLLNH